MAQHLGLPLEEIRDLLGAWEQGVCAAVRERLRPLVAARIAEAEQLIAELTAFAVHLAAVHEELGGPAPMPVRDEREMNNRRITAAGVALGSYRIRRKP